MNKPDKKWLAKVAKKNNVTTEEVVRYILSVASGKMAIHHLDLTQPAKQKKINRMVIHHPKSRMI